MLKKTLLAVIIFNIILSIGATNYFVKPDGSDSNTGLSWDEALQTITKAVSLTSTGEAVAIAAGTILDVQGTPIEAFSSTFSLDLVGPRVVDSSIQEGDQISVGDLTYTARFDKELNGTTLDPTDVESGAFTIANHLQPLPPAQAVVGADRDFHQGVGVQGEHDAFHLGRRSVRLERTVGFVFQLVRTLLAVLPFSRGLGPVNRLLQLLLFRRQLLQLVR